MRLSKLQIIASLFLFIIIGGGIYSNTLEAPFVLDDVVRIESNPDVRMTSLDAKSIWAAAFGDSKTLGRPLARFTFALNHYVHGYDLPGFHLVNIAIHILSAFFLFLFIKTTFECAGRTAALPPSMSFTIAAFASMIWMVNPLHTQSVTYIVQRQNSMAAMFYILSFLLYVKGRIHGKRKSDEKGAGLPQPRGKGKGKKPSAPKTDDSPPPGRCRWIWYLFSGLAWILALGSKQTAVTLPFFILLYELFFFQDFKWEWLKKKVKYIVVILVLFSLVAFLYLGSDPLGKLQALNDYANNEFTLKERILTQTRVVIYYLSLIFYPDPSRLNFDYDFAISRSLFHPVTTLLSLLCIVGLIGLACYLSKRQRLIAFSIFWFFGNLVIESSVIPLALIFEHRTYLPSMLIALPVVILAFRYGRNTLVVSALLCVVIALFSYWTYQRNKVWNDEIRLYADCVEKSPRKPRAYYHLGTALLNRNRIDEAVRSLSEAVRLEPDHEMAHYNLAYAMRKKGDLEKAIAQYREAVRANPDYEKAYYHLGTILLDQGRTEEAVQYLQQAVKLKPDYDVAHYNLGIAMKRQGRTEEAIAQFRQAVEIRPDFEKAHYQLGLALAKQGQTDEAIEQFRQALRINPLSGRTRERLGMALQSQGRIDEAIEQFFEALRLNPKNAGTYNNLGVALLEKGNIRGAIQQFRRALDIRHDFLTARENLLRAMEMQEEGR